MRTSPLGGMDLIKLSKMGQRQNDLSLFSEETGKVSLKIKAISMGAI